MKKLVLALVIGILAVKTVNTMIDKEFTKLEQQTKEIKSTLNKMEVELKSRAKEIEQTKKEIDDLFNDWEIREAEITGYAPLDENAVEGICYSGNPYITASGEKTTPGVTLAAPKDIPFGKRVYLPNRGEMRIVQDRGGNIDYTEDGAIQLDCCVETRDEAVNRIGRQRTAVLIEK